MANRTATLLRYARIENLGWRRGTIPIAKNGRPRLDAMIYSGTEYPIPADSHFHVRHYVDTKTVFTPAGREFEAASAMLARYEALQTLEASQKTLGIYVAPKGGVKRLAEHVAEYLRKKTADKVSPELLTLYDRTLNGFASHCGHEFATDVKQEDVTSYLDHVEAVGYAPKVTVECEGSAKRVDGSKRRRYSQKSMQVRYLAIRGFLDKECGINVSTLISKTTHKRRSKRPEPDSIEYTQSEIDRLMAVFNDYHLVVFTILLSTGLRYRELSNLTWANVNFETGKIRVVDEQKIHKRVTDRVTGATETKILEFSTKTGKSREIPIFPSLRPILESWRNDHPDAIYVVGTSSDRPDGHWLELLKGYARKEGINCGVCEGCATRNECEKVTVHRWRHTFAHKCLRAGVPLPELSRWLGHSDVSITAKVYLNGFVGSAVDPFAEKVAVIHRLQRAIDQDRQQNNFAI